MSDVTRNLNLPLHNDTTDASVPFLKWRNAMNGETNSAFLKIDEAYGKLKEEMTKITGSAIKISASGDGYGNFTATSTKLESYKKDDVICFVPDMNSTGTTMLNINGLGNKSLQKIDKDGLLTNIEKDDLIKNHEYYFRFDGLVYVWQMQTNAKDLSYIPSATLTSDNVKDAIDEVDKKVETLKINRGYLTLSKYDDANNLVESGKYIGCGTNLPDDGVWIIEVSSGKKDFVNEQEHITNTYDIVSQIATKVSKNDGTECLPILMTRNKINGTWSQWDEKASKSDLPVNVSDLVNDKGFITAKDIPSSFKGVIKSLTEVTECGYYYVDNCKDGTFPYEWGILNVIVVENGEKSAIYTSTGHDNNIYCNTWAIVHNKWSGWKPLDDSMCSSKDVEITDPNTCLASLFYTHHANCPDPNGYYLIKQNFIDGRQELNSRYQTAYLGNDRIFIRSGYWNDGNPVKWTAWTEVTAPLKLGTFNAAGASHGLAHRVICQYDASDNRFHFKKEDGQHQISVDNAKYLDGMPAMYGWMYNNHIPIMGREHPLDICEWIDFHLHPSHGGVESTDYDARLYIDFQNGGLSFVDVKHPEHNTNITSEIRNLKQSVANGKQAVVDAINNKIGYASGLTTSNSGADYAWWIQNKIGIRNIVEFNSWNKVPISHDGSAPTVVSGYMFHQILTTEDSIIYFKITSGGGGYLDGGGYHEMNVGQAYSTTCYSNTHFEILLHPNTTMQITSNKSNQNVEQWGRYK